MHNERKSFNFICEKGLVSMIYKEVKIKAQQNPNNPVNKRANELNIQL